MSENKSLIRFLGKLYKALEVEDQIKELRIENPGLEEEFPNLGEIALTVKGGPVFLAQYATCLALQGFYQALEECDDTMAMMNDPSQQISDPDVREKYEKQIKDLAGSMDAIEDYLVTQLAEAVQMGIVQMKREDNQDTEGGEVE